MSKKSFLIMIAAVSSLGGLLFGYDTGVINGSQFYLSKYFELDPATKGFVVGSALLGCFAGALLAGPLSRKFGRKHSLIISAILFTISAWGSGLPGFFPESIPLLIFFRIVGGLGIGVASMNAPMYIAEISPPDKRGNMVTYYQLAIVVGFFVVFLVTYYIGQLGDEAFNIARGWRLMFWSELVPCLLFLVLLFFIPKSPRWLAMRGRDEECMEVLKKIHPEDAATVEFNEIKESVHSDMNRPKVSLLAKGILPIVLIGVTLSALQQFTGINAVLYYGSDIFEKALGFGKEDILAQQILLAGVNLVFTFIAMATVDKLGRKPLIYIGSAGMALGFILLATTLMTGTVGLLSLIGVLLFIASFAMSMGPVVWVVLSEMFPNRIRSAAMSVAVAAQWAANYFVSQSFPIIAEGPVNNNDFWNGALPYVIFIVFIIFIFIFTKVYIPETKGKSLEELEAIWDKYRPDSKASS
ncbi:MAG: sugar porter family MFS transporter [Flavobacteriales bacterium]|nr:sugar porter family MFS transporter [Flavobacteriales bacterium]